MNASKVSNRPAGLVPLLRERYSPRAFANRPIDAAVVERLFEAARWSMSCFNGQPWRFIVAAKDDAEGYQRIFDTFAPGNQAWAGAAPLAGISVARHDFEHNGKPNRWGAYDTGQAMACLTIQAQAEGLSVHQMGGFDAAKAKESLGVPDGYEPMAAFVIGYAGDPATLSDDFRARETAPGERKPLETILYRGLWTEPR
jgi:nitroreductase